MSYQSRLELIVDSRGSERDLRRFENRLSDVDRAGGRASESMSTMNSRMDNIGRVAKVAGGALLGLTAGAGIFTAIARGASQSAREIENFSNLANTTTQEFQRMSFASAEFGVEQSKLADILKDVNDRVGEFMQTGGGEMSDFFEKIAPRVGVTANQFARLSGPEALQLYYQSLQDANLSQQEMTFYMESMADEASALIPLLRDNGAEMNRLAGEADKLNIVLSDVENRRLDDLRGEFSQLEQQLSTETMRAVSQFDDLMKSSLEGISMGVNDLARGFNVFMDSFRENDVKRSVAGIDAELHKLFDTKARLEQRIDMFGADSEQAQDSIAALEDLRSEYTALIDRKKELQQAALPVEEPEILQIERASAGLKTLDEWLFEIPDSAGDATTALADQSDTVDTLADAYDSLLDRITPNRAEAKQYAQDLGVLNLALASGRMNAEQYMQAMGMLQESFQDAQRDTEDTADTVDDESDRMATLWERQLERMDDAGVDMWRSFLDGSEGAFDSFKNLALDTLAEVIHAYTTRQITASLGFDAQGQMSGGQQQGGMNANSMGDAGDLVSYGKKGYDYFFGGSGATAGSAPVNYASGFGSQTATGSYGGWAGNASGAAGSQGGGWMSAAGSNAMSGLYTAGAGMAGTYAGSEFGGAISGKQANSNYGATIGTTAGAVIGSVVPVIGTYLGAAIGGFLGSTADVLFGSGRESYGQIGSEVDPGEVGQGVNTYGDIEGYTGKSAFGTIGISKKQKTDDDALKDMVSSFVEIDNALASVMNEAQLEDTEEALDGWRSSKTSNIGDIVRERMIAVVDAADSEFDKALEPLQGENLVTGLVAGIQIENVGEKMASAVADDMNSAFRDVLRDGTDIQESAQAILNSASAVQILGDSTERLNLQFDDAAKGALAAAGGLFEYVGGLENLSSVNQAYYEAAFTENERLSNSQADLFASLSDVTNETPRTVAELRAMVEAQNLNSESGQQLAYDLMHLAPALKETNASVRQAIEQFYQDELGREPDSSGLDYWFNQVASGALTLEGALWNIEKAAADAGVSLNGAADLLSPVQDAWAALNASVDAERDILEAAYNETASSIRSNMDVVQASIRETESAAQSLQNALRDTQSGTAFAREQGQASLRRMLAAGEVTDQRELDNALGAVAEPSEQLFGSFLDYQRDFVGTAHDIYNLSELTTEQLSNEEKSLRALERQLETADMQYQRELARLDGLLESEAAQLEAQFGTQEWLSSVNDSVISVEAAVSALQGAINAAGGDSESGGSGEGSSGSEVDRIYRDMLGKSAQESEVAYWESTGLSGKELRDTIEYSAWKHNQGVDGSHANGLWSVPFDGYRAELHRDETVLPAKAAEAFRQFSTLPIPTMPAMPQLNQGGSNDMAVLIKRIEALTEQNKTQGGMQREALKALKALVRQLERWDDQDRVRVSVEKTVEPTA